MDIPNIARTGVDRAWALAASALRPVTVRSLPTTTYDPTTDTTTVAWGSETALLALIWGEKGSLEPQSKDAQHDAPSVARTAKIMIRKRDLTVAPTTATTIVEGDKVWKVAEVVTTPVDAIHVLSIQL